MLGIDMADISESEGDSSDRDRDGKESSRNGPTQALCPVKELLSWRDIPADLKMHGERAYEDPNRH